MTRFCRNNNHKWIFDSEIWENGKLIHKGNTKGLRCTKCGATKAPLDDTNNPYSISRGVHW
jgi:hypothetical protein